MTALDANELHEIASGFVTKENPRPGIWRVYVGEVFIDAFGFQHTAEQLQGLLVVEIMKLLTEVQERLAKRSAQP